MTTATTRTAHKIISGRTSSSTKRLEAELDALVQEGWRIARLGTSSMVWPDGEAGIITTIILEREAEA